MSKVSVLTFAAFVAVSASSASEERIPWQHPSLEMYRAGVSDDGDRARIQLCVRPKEGLRAGTISVGFPRYKRAWGRWTDCAIVGIDRSRSVHASIDTGPACFAILLPPDAVAFELPVDDRTLEIAVAERKPEPEPVTQVDDSWGREPAPAAPPSPPPPRRSDVDGDIAPSLSTRPSALAVVFGVENYAKAPAATFAAADAKTAARYLEKALGVPAARIELLQDGEATLGQMQRVFGEDGWLARRVSPDSEIFVFFAGHGMADVEKFSPYLLPADADPDYLRQTGLSLDKLIAMIGSLGARRTTLFLDACFSGLSREGVPLLADARPLLIEQAPRVPAGLSIFSAGSGSQIVSSLDEQGHGVFSYYLFKGLAGDADVNHDRRVLASELKTYLEGAVPPAAQTLDREQTPGIVLADPDETLVQLP